MGVFVKHPTTRNDMHSVYRSGIPLRNPSGEFQYTYMYFIIE